jgi:hypothetical protein
MELSVLKPIRLMIPVNLRNIYPSKSMRNFFLTITPSIDPRLGHFTFEEVLHEVHHYLLVEVNNKFINQQIKRNVSGELNPIVRTIPLFLKIWVEKILYNKVSSAIHSGVLTNLGKVDLPEPLNESIERFEFIPNPNPATKKNIGVISFHDKIYITFASMIQSNEIEQIFF